MKIGRRIKKSFPIPESSEECRFEEKCARCHGEGVLPKEVQQEGPILVVRFAGGVEMFQCNGCSGMGTALTAWGKELVDHLIDCGFEDREELRRVAEIVESAKAVVFAEEAGQDVPESWVEKGFFDSYWLKDTFPPDPGSPKGS